MQKISCYADFLKRGSHRLHLKTIYSNRPFISIPENSLSSTECNEFFASLPKSLQSAKKLILNVDPTHQLGTQRLFNIESLNKKAFKHEISCPSEYLLQTNPNTKSISDIKEIKFDSLFFFLSDPLFNEQRQALNPHDFDKFVSKYYESNPQRGYERLILEYGMNPAHARVFEAAHNADYEIYMVGMSMYTLRRIIGAYYSLKNVKTVFLKGTGRHHEYLMEELYDNVLARIEHSHLSSMLSLFSSETPFGAHEYSIPTTKRIDLSKSDEKIHQFVGSSIPVDIDSDADKIEKHAILEVMLGPLWQKSYTMNPFPYLSENYFSLSLSDKEALKELFLKYLKAYSAFKDKKETELGNKKPINSAPEPEKRRYGRR